MGTAALVLVLLLSLHLTGRLRNALEGELTQRLRLAAEITTDEISNRAEPIVSLDTELAERLEEIRRATSVTNLVLYDRAGNLLPGAGGREAVSGVPRKLRLPSRPGNLPASPGLRLPERDGSGGVTLVVPLGHSAGVGAVLTRIDKEGRRELAAVELFFTMGKWLAIVVLAAGVLILLRWVSRGGPEPTPRSTATLPNSDVDVVLGTVREVMTTLKDSETDYRDRMTAAQADAEQHRQTNDLILDSITSGIVAFDRSARITMFNRAAEEILVQSGSGSLGRRVGEVFGVDDPITRIARRLLERERTSSRVEMERTLEDGETRWLGISSSVIRRRSGQPAGGILLLTDLTETRRLREQMGLRDRLSAVGEMSAGIAHEIKNSLHSLMGLANLLKQDLGDEEPPMPVKGILSEVKSLETMVQGVLQFSKPALLLKAPTRLNELVVSTRDAVQGEADGHDIDLELDLEDGLPEIELDAESVRRVFLNLALNAIEAMGEGGTLTITTRTAELFGEGDSPGRPGVRVGFRDTGPGVPEIDRSRIFTPFYSTKRDGNGLGLALSHKTITDHGGRMNVHSRENVGTEFVILLPLEA